MPGQCDRTREYMWRHSAHRTKYFFINYVINLYLSRLVIKSTARESLRFLIIIIAHLFSNMNFTLNINEVEEQQTYTQEQTHRKKSFVP